MYILSSNSSILWPASITPYPYELILFSFAEFRLSSGTAATQVTDHVRIDHHPKKHETECQHLAHTALKKLRPFDFAFFESRWRKESRKANPHPFPLWSDNRMLETWFP